MTLPLISAWESRKTVLDWTEVGSVCNSYVLSARKMLELVGYSMGVSL